MDLGVIEFLVNGATQGKLKGIYEPVYPAMTLCEMTGGGVVLKNVPYS